MNECKPLARGEDEDDIGAVSRAAGRGLHFVHFSARPEPFLTRNTP